jgi:hypothetical protein
VTGLLVIVGTITAIVLYLQSRHMRRTVAAMLREFRTTHRPKIRIKHVWLHRPLEAGEPVMVQLVTMNTGSLPATIIGFDVVTHVLPSAMHPPNEYHSIINHRMPGT